MPLTPMQAWFSRPLGELEGVWPRALAAGQTKGAQTALSPAACKKRLRDQERELISDRTFGGAEEKGLRFMRSNLAGRPSTVQAKVAVRCCLEIANHLTEPCGVNASLIVACLLALALCGGCNKSAEPETSPMQDPGEPTQAQPKLATMKLWVGPEEMIVELALTADQQRTGMMFRTNMAENAGMLFPLAVTQRASFWMKNCPLPLSAAYIDPEGVIQEIREFHPHDTNGVVAASNNIRFVLETPQGWFDRHSVRAGMIVRTERGSLMETFFRGR
jgi:uncharacterized membrane protein (UPF0127 family)